MKRKSNQPSTFKVPQNPGPHKNQKKLDARIRDWETIKDKSGFHKPGSLQ